MPEQPVSFLQRLGLALYVPFAVLFRDEVARGVLQLREADRAGERPPAGTVAPSPGAAVERAEAPGSDTRAALQLLVVLQREGRLVDFLQEDLTAHSDADVGAAARTVHEGCRRALAELLRFEPIYTEPEGAQVTVAAGFDAAAVRLTGNVVGSPPFRGSLRHHGWRAVEVKLPSPPAASDPTIVAPAEVEL